jgi:hypothetical protein
MFDTAKESRPLLIYLDSSDYSRLSSSTLKTDTKHAPILKYLQEGVSARRIEIRFSMAHVVEACHKDAQSKSFAMDRASLIAALSGKRVMLWIESILRNEIQAGESASPRNALAQSDAGDWFPESSGIGGDVQRDLQQNIEKLLVEMPKSRQQRRKLKSMYGSPGNLRKDARKRLFDDQDFISSLCHKYGLSEEFAKSKFRRILLSEADPAETDRHITEELFEPVRFIGNYVDRFKGRAIVGTLREIGEEIVSTSINAQSRIRESAINLLNDGKSIEILSRRHNQAAFFNSFVSQTLERVTEKLGGKAGSELASLVCRAESNFPGLSCMVKAVFEWMYDVIAYRENPRTPKPSDAGDFLHMYYLPYVDLWRGDAYSSSLACRAWPSCKGKVVGSLFDLPERIESALKLGAWA